MKTLNEQIVEEAKSWLGTPFQHRSWSKFGCDCTGLVFGVVIEVLKKNGISVTYPIRLYPKDWNFHSMADNHIIDELNRFAVVIPKSETSAGDIIVFHVGRCVSHIGIKMQGDLFIHSLGGRNVKYDRLRQNVFAKRWVQSFRLSDDKIKEYTDE